MKKEDVLIFCFYFSLIKKNEEGRERYKTKLTFIKKLGKEIIYWNSGVRNKFFFFEKKIVTKLSFI